MYHNPLPGTSNIPILGERGDEELSVGTMRSHRWNLCYRGSGMLPRQAIYRLLLRQGPINFARVGTAVPCLPSMFPSYFYLRDSNISSQSMWLSFSISSFVLLSLPYISEIVIVLSSEVELNPNCTSRFPSTPKSLGFNSYSQAVQALRFAE